MKEKLPENLQQRLLELVRQCEQEDRATRERQVRQWRQLKLFWEGFQRVYYSEVAHDWRIYDESLQEPTDQASYDKPVNVYRAFLESLIAALSVTVPPIKCYPDDADNLLDLSTARTGDKIAQLLYRHNDAPLLWLHALFIFMTEGLVACYSYPKEDAKYGTYEDKKYEDVDEIRKVMKCPECKAIIGEALASDPNKLENLNEGLEEKLDEEKDEFMSDDDEKQEYCEACTRLVTPELAEEKFVVTKFIGTTTKPKSRICMEVYGGLYVKVPNYAKTQEQCPYLLFSYETNYAFILERYPDLKGKIKTTGSHGAYDQYDQWGRLNPQYRGEYPINVVTIKHCWIRPAMFYTLNDDAERDSLLKKYPNGVKVTLANDTFADAYKESLDDCWTLTHNPLSDYLHHDPLGMLLVGIQEITNDLISLTLQTIEHGISLLFADPTSLSFKAFESTEVTPGGVFPATTKTGKQLSDSFYEVTPAHLSAEVLPFFQNIQNLGQAVSGALPSLSGGAPTKGDTAAQYSMSRAQAMQRLQMTWKMLIAWWRQIFGKVIPMYISEVKEDEKDVQKDSNGNFMNVFIRKAELEGRIGKIELEASDNLPITWAQQKDVIMQLLMAANPKVLEVIASPEAIPYLRQALGLPDLYIPGEDDREKQYEEIRVLLGSEPISDVGQDGSEIPLPTIEPEEVDNHEIHFETCRKWAVSEAGRQAKIDNVNGYKNVLLHAQMHNVMIAHMNAASAMNPQNANPSGNGQPPPEKPNVPNLPGAPSGDSNATNVS